MFDTMHIRRSVDFERQFGKLETAEEIYEIAKADLVEGGTVYIATDEKDKTFFEPLKAHYDVVFLSDFSHLFKGFDPYLLGMLDQLVASRGRKFFGTWSSTYSGYINRIRGYHSTKHKLDGYQDGIIESYYNEPENRNDMQAYHSPLHAWFVREFPLAWRDIDHDLEDGSNLVQ